MKKVKVLLALSIITLSSCSKDDDNSSGKSICTECSASYAGMTTTPAQFCGPKNEVELFENRYKEINRNASVRCVRKK